MIRTPALLEHAARRLGGPRVLALPFLRVLAAMLGAVWVALAPEADGRRAVAAVIVAIFVAYSATVITLLWLRPQRVLRHNLAVLVVDLGFALALVASTGGARSTLFLALLVIAGLQSYYHGITRGILVGVASSVAYLVVTWPTLGTGDWADVVVRLATLLGTAIGIGLLADLEVRREQYIANVIGRLREGVVALDANGRVVTWNDAMARRYGVHGSEAVGRDFFALFGVIADRPWAQALRRLLRGEVEDFAFDAVEHDTPRRGRVVVNLKASLLRDGHAPAGAVLLVEDVTERVRLEQSARQAEKLAAVGTLAAGVAHELNNPIGVISSRVELMLLDAEAHKLPEEVREDLAVLHRHAQRVARIAEGLLSFARQAPRDRAPVDVNRLVEDTLLLAEKSIAREGVQVRRRLAPDVPVVWGDANALQQVLVNLLTNARDALEGAGDIEVRTERTPRGDARVTVRDTGPGIPPDALGRIFEPFFTTKPEGTGLGLAISYGIVRDHHGTVEVDSRPGEGTAFTLILPATTRAAA